jgi:hypothetical protein
MDWRIALVGLAGCNAVFGLHRTEPYDAPVSPPSPDAPVLVIPPDGATDCGSATIDFASWTFDPVAVPPETIFAMSTYDDGGAERALFTGTDGGGGQPTYHVYDWDFAGTPTTIPNLDAPPGAPLTALGLSPDGDTVWLVQTMVADGVYYATRASSWTEQRADLGLSQPDPEPGAVGFYDGTIRMVAAVNPNAGSPRLVELSSTDGLHWTQVPASLGSAFEGFAGVHTPSLSPDACVLLFAAATAQFQFNIYAAFRDATGVFGAPVQIAAQLSSLASPVLSTDRTSIWFTSFASSEQLFRGHP